MVRVIIVYLIIIGISILVGLSIRLESGDSSLHEGTNIKDFSFDRDKPIQCEGGICPPHEEYKDGSD